ncbi:hypothetical protein SPRG_21827 [Saprolegnia parasitica CBS 223.65]|uniref:Uncharacterized protein n=1 Tax=Saprolegnia parasitica (strain CBS 223.65) TaxID=695850 RepID=A0A067BTX1_SAPPC|nr:hypothetical protein SPRG_21827 [Saprolegnia parasitica CBS 223.65]KDO17716.1 hypothetical protein SPRG_21827 [Saprolegnia parasitica CBS 223.65]|eukprot:XP_012211575.1 hypothetical protein SPRG_21827 [Saprolegnia parasitica CBS 223.65]
MYCHLSRVYWQIQDAFADASDADRAALEVTQPFLGLVKDQIQPFEAWPRGKIAQMVAPDPIDDVSTHPMASAARTTPSALSSYLRRVRRTCGLAPPVQSDVWLRLFGFRPGRSTADVVWSHKWRVARIRQYEEQFSILGIDFSRAFDTIDRAKLLTVLQSFLNDDEVRLVRMLLTTTTLRLRIDGKSLIWEQHNGVQYEQKRAIPAAAWHDLSFVGWMASVRHWLRLQDADCPKRAAVLDVVRTLHGQPAYQPLAAKYPLLLRLGPSLRPA